MDQFEQVVGGRGHRPAAEEPPEAAPAVVVVFAVLGVAPGRAVRVPPIATPFCVGLEVQDAGTTRPEGRRVGEGRRGRTGGPMNCRGRSGAGWAVGARR